MRDDRVWLKTIDGLQRVHAIVRRQDDDYCDPLELRSDSALGVAGLTDCARRGNVLLANALGSGVLESGALLGYLPRLSRELLGEPLQLPSVATWWLGEPAAFDDAWQRLERLIIKPLERSPSEPAIVVGDLSADEREALRAAHRRAAAALRRAGVGARLAGAGARARTTLGDRSRARTVGLRVFAVATPSGWRVMPGGLTRVAGDEDSRDHRDAARRPLEGHLGALRRAGQRRVLAALEHRRRPTTWSAPTRRCLRAPPRTCSGSAATASAATRPRGCCASRSARCSRTAGDARRHARRRWTLAERLGLDREDAAARRARCGAPRPIPKARSASACASLSRVAFNLRDRMSVDHWRTLNRLIGDPVLQREPALPMTLVWLDRAITSMMTLSGFVLDGMTRGIGWRFVSIGRRIERLATMCSALQVAIDEGRTHELDWLLELADSSVTYRSRYLAAPEWLPVLDMVMRDEANPRSLAFQAKGLAEFIAKLEASHGRVRERRAGAGARRAARAAPGDLAPESERAGRGHRRAAARRATRSPTRSR